jgi:hypothetical protein
VRTPGPAPRTLFEIHTFVNDDALYERMRRSFINAGFASDSFVRLTDASIDRRVETEEWTLRSTGRGPAIVISS